MSEPVTEPAPTPVLQADIPVSDIYPVDFPDLDTAVKAIAEALHASRNTASTVILQVSFQVEPPPPPEILQMQGQQALPPLPPGAVRIRGQVRGSIPNPYAEDAPVIGIVEDDKTE